MQQLERSERYIDLIEVKFDVKFELGRNTSIEFMAHLWEPLRWIHKPLVLFLGAEMMLIATDALLYAQGFRSYRQQVTCRLDAHSHQCPFSYGQIRPELRDVCGRN